MPENFNGDAEISRRQVLRSIGLGTATVAIGSALGGSSALVSGTAAQAAAATAPDAWSPLVVFRTPDGRYAAPIHATVLPSGDVHFIGAARPTPAPDESMVFSRYSFSMAPNPLTAPFPAQVTGKPLPEPMDITNQVIGRWLLTDDLFCAGHGLLADGRFFTDGGIQNWKNLDTGEYVFTGLSYATIMEAGGWRRVKADMVGKTEPIGQPLRWYPTVTRLPDGRMMVASGNDELYPVNRVNLTVETFNPVDESWTLISAFGSTPIEIWNHDYTHTFVLPKPIGPYQALSFGEAGVSVLQTTTSPVKWKIGSPRPGSEQFQADRKASGEWDSEVAPMSGATTAPLPIRVKDGEWGYANGSVLIAGGPDDSAYSRRIDIHDPVAGTWRRSIDTGISRHDPTAVCLPDGRMLVVGGLGPVPDVYRMSYVDPAAGFSHYVGASAGGETRSYHGVAVLLPDGRVLCAGGRDADDDAQWTEKVDGRYYYPPYMFVARPSIVSAPANLAINGPFAVTTSGAKPVEAVLMGLGSQTHCFDSNQRYVQLRVLGVAGSGARFTCSLLGPPNRTTAPPGHYMLFILDAARIPSIAKIVRLLP